MIHYAAWINLFVLVLKLFPTFNDAEDLKVKATWKSLEEIGMRGNEQAMYVEFLSKENNKSLITYILIPWENISLQDHNDDISSFFGLSELLCVTPYAIIREQTSPDDNEHEVVLKEKITTFCSQLFNSEVYSKRIDYAEGFTLSEQYQVMTMRQFPYLVDLSIAVPGSAHLDPEVFKNEFSNTMVYVSMIPDIGNVFSSWLKVGDAPELHSVIDFQDELIDRLKLYVTSLNSMKDIAERTATYKKHNKEMIDFLDSHEMDKTIQNFYSDLIRRLFCVPMEQMKQIKTDPVFGNYQPKTTPDIVTDYMPKIRDEIEKLPEEKLENLIDLINLFQEYKKQAVANPGKIVEGNIMLGGLPEEYQPSKEELILAEIGNRIYEIKCNNNREEIGKYLSQLDSEKREFTYQKFTFIHYDVMGSGRFFYVNSKEKVDFTIP